MSEKLENILNEETLNHNKAKEQGINIKDDQTDQSQIVNGEGMKMSEQSLSNKQQKQPITVNLFDQKLERASSIKSEGNVYFKNKDYAQAIKTYTGGLQELNPNQFYGATKEQCEKMADISSILLFNMGTCYFNSYDWQRAQIFYTEAITINPKYTKAIHKRALTRYELKRYEDAFTDIKLAFSQDKKNEQIYKSYQKILQKYNEWIRQSKKNEKSFSANIFNKESKKSDSPLKKEPTQTKAPQNKTEFSWSGLASGLTAVGLIGFTLYRFLHK